MDDRGEQTMQQLTIELHCGNCLDIMQTLPENKFDLIFTSPPYYNAREYSNFTSYGDYLEFLKRWLFLASYALKPNCILAINLSCVIEPREKRSKESTRLPIPFDVVPMAREIGYKLIDDIIWEKPDGASNRAIAFAGHRRPVAYKTFQVTEYILVFKNGDGLLDTVVRSHSEDIIRESLISDGYERTNVWKISPERVGGHPAPFPLQLARNVVSYYSYVGDNVLDPFMGSGTTGLACVEFGRNFYGIEKSEEYFQVAKRRVEEIQNGE